MLYLALMTLILFTSPLEREVDRTVDEYLSQLNLASTRYVVVITNQELQGAAVRQSVEAGKDSMVFFFDRELLLQLSKQERRVLIAHEVGHLAPQCHLGGSRIFRELCADRIASQLVPMEDVAAMLTKSLLMFPYYPAREEFLFRLVMIQEKRHISEEIEPTKDGPSELPSQDAGIDCA
jgi:hypothetical protein